jgi:hypothetical protein
VATVLTDQEHHFESLLLAYEYRTHATVDTIRADDEDAR